MSQGRVQRSEKYPAYRQIKNCQVQGSFSTNTPFYSFRLLNLDDKHSESSTVDETNERDSRAYLKRQNSNAIGTDNTGAAVRTINNILNGITDSVNRLSELHVQIADTPRNKKVRSTGVSPRNHIKNYARQSNERHLLSFQIQ